MTMAQAFLQTASGVKFERMGRVERQQATGLQVTAEPGVAYRKFGLEPLAQQHVSEEELIRRTHETPPVIARAEAWARQAQGRVADYLRAADQADVAYGPPLRDHVRARGRGAAGGAPRRAGWRAFV